MTSSGKPEETLYVHVFVVLGISVSFQLGCYLPEGLGSSANVWQLCVIGGLVCSSFNYYRQASKLTENSVQTSKSTLGNSITNQWNATGIYRKTMENQ